MNARTLIGALLVGIGALILTLRGISYTKERETVAIGPLQIAAEKKGFVPPAVGVVLIVAGAVLLVLGRRRSA